MMVNSINSGTGATSIWEAFGSVRSRTPSHSPVQNGNSSGDFFESLSAAISKSTTFQDRVNALFQEIKLNNDRSLGSEGKRSSADNLAQGLRNKSDSNLASDSEVSRIAPALLALLAIPDKQSLNVTA